MEGEYDPAHSGMQPKSLSSLSLHLSFWKAVEGSVRHHYCGCCGRLERHMSSRGKQLSDTVHLKNTEIILVSYLLIKQTFIMYINSLHQLNFRQLELNAQAVQLHVTTHLFLY